MHHTLKYKKYIGKLQKDKLIKLLGSYPTYRSQIFFFLIFKNSYKFLFFLSIILGTFIAISSTSWFRIWIGLEINLLSFIPLIRDNNLISTEASLKYFLIQVLASAVLLFSIIIIIFNFESYIINNNRYINNLLLSRLLLKTGAAPFHFWFPNIIEGLSWLNRFILITWQKIAPFILISYTINQNIIIYCAILSVIFGALGGLNQTLLRKLIAYSSINHLGWIISSLLLSESLWIIYFIFYSFLSLTLILIFNIFKLYHLNQIFSLFFHSKILKFTLLFNLLSLGGLPPFLGFMPKWLIINALTINNQYLLTSLLISFTLITLFFYLRICYTGFIINYYEPNWINLIISNKNNLNNYLILSSISIFGLIFINLIYLIL